MLMRGGRGICWVVGERILVNLGLELGLGWFSLGWIGDEIVIEISRVFEAEGEELTGLRGIYTHLSY